MEQNILDKTQICVRCKIQKPFGDFYKNKRSKSGYNYACKKCISNKRKEEYKNNCEKIKAIRKEYYKKNKDSILAKAKIYQKDNLHIFRKSNKKWRENNKQKMKELVKNWSQNNKDRRRYGYAKRRALKKQATPHWADQEKIKKIYEGACALERVTGLKYHVDHIIPLNHPDVCGLHVWANLQILEAELNISKGNRYE